jgi:hypothetical protein
VRFVVVVAEYGHDRQAEPLANLSREPASLLGLSVIRQVAAQDERIGVGGDVVEDRPQRLRLVASKVEVGDRREPDLGA